MRIYHPYFSPLRLLKLSLALVFVWFGALKLFGVSPVVAIIESAYPFIAQNQALFYVLALFEIALGVGIFVPRVEKVSAWAMIVHLFFATTGVLVSPQAFIGGFPLLSVVGEFVVKNLVLMAGTLVVIYYPDIKNH